VICLNEVSFLEMLAHIVGIIVWGTVIYKLYKWIERDKND
jgi:hypothetical protein